MTTFDDETNATPNVVKRMHDTVGHLIGTLDKTLAGDPQQLRATVSELRNNLQGLSDDLAKLQGDVERLCDWVHQCE